MKKEWARVGIAAVMFFCSLLTFAQGGTTNAVKGIVMEGGFNKFKLQDKSGTSWLFYPSRKVTAYEPDDWRPSEGDEVAVTSMEVKQRDATILQANQITLLKAGPNTVRIKSPVEVEIVEAGRRGFRAKILSVGATVQFGNQRGMQMVPAGWLPATGERAIVTFITKPVPIGYALGYYVVKMEKVDAGKKAE